MNDKKFALPDGRPRQWQDWLSLVLGAWIFVSPWVIYPPQTAELVLWNSWVVGAAIVIIALSAIVRFREWEEWITGVLGLWLVVSPWLLGFSDMRVATWNAVVCGLLVMALAIEEVWEVRQFGQKQA